MNRKDVKLHQVIGKGEFGGKWFTVRTAASRFTDMQTPLRGIKGDLFMYFLRIKMKKNKNINDSVSLF